MILIFSETNNKVKQKKVKKEIIRWEIIKNQLILREDLEIDLYLPNQV